MNKRVAWWSIVFLCSACVNFRLVLAEEAKESGTAEPQKVGEEAKILMRKVSLEFVDTPLHETLEFMKEFTKVETLASQGTGDKTVTLKLQNATLAEALRQIKDQAGAVYRLVDGKLLLATPEEWKAIDAGKAKFEVYVALKRPASRTDAPLNALLNEDQAALKTIQRTYVVEGKSYTEEELKKAYPEIWEGMKTGRIISQSEGKAATYKIGGKTYSEEELKKEFPDIYKQVKAKQEKDAQR